MARPLDPFRTLELRRDATLDDVKTAYRRLAKLYHPDSAGERALHRFLAVQAAYEALTEGPGRLRPAIGSRPRSTSLSTDAAGTRARRTGEAPSGRSAGSGPRAGRRSDPTGPAAPGSGGGPTGAASGSGSSRADGESRDRGSTGPRPRRVRRAPGSTSYDGVDKEPFEPEWEGASWYGGSSGTYWTINPREFADPRKHGPEYLARGRAGEPPRSRRARGGHARAGETATPGGHPAGMAGDTPPDRAFAASSGTWSGDGPEGASGPGWAPASAEAPPAWDGRPHGGGPAPYGTGTAWSPAGASLRPEPSASWLLAVGLLGIAVAAVVLTLLLDPVSPGAASVVPAVAIAGVAILILVRWLRREGRPRA